MNEPTLEARFLHLLTRHLGIVRKVCAMYARQTADQQDLFQDIAGQLWRAFPSFRGDAEFATWAYRIALNTAIAGIRRQQRRPQATPLSDALLLQLPDAPYDDTRDQQLAAMWRAIDQLSEVERAVVLLYLEGYSYAAMGEILGMTQSLIGVKINRIKQKIKNVLAIA